MENRVRRSEPETFQKVNRGASIRSMVSSIIIKGALPFVMYWMLTQYTNTSEFLALVASGVPPLIITFQGGSPKVYLLRESFFTVAFGLALLVSLMLPRPLMFYFARYFGTGNHPENIVRFNSLWQYAGFRTSMRVITVVWGVGFLLEAAIRIYLVFT